MTTMLPWSSGNAGQLTKQRHPAGQDGFWCEEIPPGKARFRYGGGEIGALAGRARALARLEEDRWHTGSFAEHLDEAGFSDPASPTQQNRDARQVTVSILDTAEQPLKPAKLGRTADESTSHRVNSCRLNYSSV
ncbi:hypothetical protein [Fodinicola feengrottensis]|uniref:hypothetical protein n=1 Tax=Fodinicola feengrottensis TaxID=435914 RepID=UPI002443445A|nr:hypothetical protein [Fodinicola feengrottensis]